MNCEVSPQSTKIQRAKSREALKTRLSGMAEKLKASVKRFMAEEEGQSTVEYILMLAVVVMVAMQFRNKFRTKVDQMVDNLGNDLNNSIDRASQ